MKEITTLELQKVYDTWYRHMKVGEEAATTFWDLVQIDKDKSYIMNKDAWKLTPESELMINIINSPYRNILYKAWKIRHT